MQPFSAVSNLKYITPTTIATGATFTVPYPTGQNQASLTGTTLGQLALASGDAFPQASSGNGTVAFAFGASNITVTNNTGVAIPANTEMFLSFGAVDINGSYNVTTPRKVQALANT